MGEIGVVLINLFDYDYHIRQGDRIALLIQEKVLETQYQEVTHIKETGRGTKGFGSTYTKKIEIDEMSTTTYKKSRGRGDKKGLLWGRYNNGKLELLATNISTELAIQNKKGQQEKNLNEIVPEEYWDYQRVFQKEEATELPTRGRPRDQHGKRKTITPEENISPRSQGEGRTRGIDKNKEKKRMDTRLICRWRFTNNVYQKERRKVTVMRRLSRTQRHHQKGSVPTAFNGRGLRSTSGSKVFHKTRHQRRIPQYTNKERRRMEDYLHHQVRNI